MPWKPDRLLHQAQRATVKNPDPPLAKEFNAEGEKVKWLPSLSFSDPNHSAELSGDETTQVITLGEQRNVTERSVTTVEEERISVGYVALWNITVIFYKW